MAVTVEISPFQKNLWRTIISEDPKINDYRYSTLKEMVPVLFEPPQYSTDEDRKRWLKRSYDRLREERDDLWFKLGEGWNNPALAGKHLQETMAEISRHPIYGRLERFDLYFVMYHEDSLEAVKEKAIQKEPVVKITSETAPVPVKLSTSQIPKLSSLEDILPDDIRTRLRQVMSWPNQGFGQSTEALVINDLSPSPDEALETNLGGHNPSLARNGSAIGGIEVTNPGALPRENSGPAGKFEEVYQSYQERIYNCIYRIVGVSEEAHDLTQETFLRAYIGLPKIEGDLKVGPWLYRIATNLCMDQLRRRKLIRWEDWESFTALFHPKQVAIDNPERDVIRQESRELVHATLQQLPPRYRISLILFEHHGLSCEQIAEVIGSSRSAVKSLLFRARNEFAIVYKRLGGEPETAVS